MTERKVVEELWDGEAPSGHGRNGYETYTETNEMLVSAIKFLIESNEWRHYRITGFPEITVHKCWSGYSEYTITSTWDEIEIVWGEHKLYYDHISKFFKALSEVNSESSW